VRRTMRDFHRLWKADPETSCWVWQGSGSGKMGYGRVMIDNFRWKAHRLSWHIHHGEIPDGLEVCHKCDNPKCVNPAHLFLGSHAENMRDAIAKNRTVIGRVGVAPIGYTGLPGARNPKAKLTEAQVIEIRNSAEKAPLLAKKYGVSRTTIYWIRNGRQWRSVPIAISSSL
jgi:DNA-binding XRE family transcriptional regulator